MESLAPKPQTSQELSVIFFPLSRCDGCFNEYTFYFRKKIAEVIKIVVTFLFAFHQKYLVTKNTTTMNKYFKLNIVVFICFICTFSSCSDDKSTTTTTDSTAATGISPNTNTGVAQGEPHPLSGNLDILVAPRAAFTDLNPGTKLVYSHNFGSDGKPHLKGFVLVGTVFSGTTMELQNGTPSNETYDNDTYFSNVVLHPGEFNKVRNELIRDPNWQYVLFLPYKVDTYFVGYHLYPSVTSAFTSQAFAPVADANPSPPRTY
jgi:hypothetical protein